MTGVDRRRCPRYAIKLRGVVGRPGGFRTACLIRDFCSGGMLLQRLSDAASAAQAAFAIGDSVQLSTELLTPSGPRAFRVAASVAWIAGDDMGIAFEPPSDDVVAALQQHARQLQPPAHAAVSSPTEARCLARLRHVAAGRLPAVLGELLAVTRSGLIEAAAQVSSNVAQQQLFEDVAALEPPVRVDELMQGLMAHSSRGHGAAAPAGFADSGELSLVERDEFERWLEASGLARHLEDRFQEALGNIGTRLNTLRNHAQDVDTAVPFEPQQLARALHDMARRLELCPASRTVLFEQAEAVLGRELAGFYAELDAELAAMGATAAKRPLQVKVRPAPARRPERAGGKGEGGAAGHPAGTVAPGLDPQLLAQLLAGEARRRETLAHELVGLVGEVPGQTRAMHDWLQRLENALTREAVADQTFFQNPHHPMRKIVDGLWHLQMFRPSPERESDADPLRQQIDELLAPFGSGRAEAALLREVATEVGELVGQHSRQYQRNAERVAQSSEGRERLRRARRAVISELNRRYAGRRVPALVPELLAAGWQALLELAWLREADDDARYAELLGLLDSLVALLGGEAFERSALEADAAALQRRLNTELTGASFDPFLRNGVEERLRAELAATDERTPALQLFTALRDDEHETAHDEVPEGVSERGWQQVCERCSTLTVGDRVRISGDDGAWQDLRIAWIRHDGRLFTLVDHRGLRVRDITLGELALGTLRRAIEPVRDDGRAASERAVSSMLERMEQRLSYHAAHDSLTGLANRQQFHAAIERALSNGSARAVVLWIDLDQFRLFNDIHGYDAGDQLLVGLADHLGSQVPDGTVAHLGGDRFAVLHGDMDLDAAEQLAAAVCAAVSGLPVAGLGQKTSATASVGVVALRDTQGGLGGVLQAADAALVAAKAAGGDRAFVYREDDPDIARRKESVQWLAQVDDALDRGRLHLRCQPIVPTRPGGGLVPHYEVLLGVASETSGALPIAQFIEAAEQYNRMRAVDRWVTRTVMEWIAAHRERMPALHGFAVNLSGQTASDAGFVDFVREQFQRTGIEPEWLSFEVTETAAVADLTRSAGIIRDLKRLGCRIALDDFGSGLASYSYLKGLPVDYLKIDGVFVRKIAGDREDHAVVRSINDIGHFLGKRTIAEYVCDDQILHLVREIGVDYVQGFAISPPMLMDDLDASGELAVVRQAPVPH